MKEIILKIRAMPKEELDKYQKGRWKKAFQISINNFDTWWDCPPPTYIGDIVDKIKIKLKEL